MVLISFKSTWVITVMLAGHHSVVGWVGGGRLYSPERSVIKPWSDHFKNIIGLAFICIYPLSWMTVLIQDGHPSYIVSRPRVC